MEGIKDQAMESDDEFDINSYIEVNIDQTNVDTIVKNEMGHPSLVNMIQKIQLMKQQSRKNQMVTMMSKKH